MHAGVYVGMRVCMRVCIYMPAFMHLRVCACMRIRLDGWRASMYNLSLSLSLSLSLCNTHQVRSDSEDFDVEDLHGAYY